MMVVETQAAQHNAEHTCMTSALNLDFFSRGFQCLGFSVYSGLRFVRGSMLGLGGLRFEVYRVFLV